MADTEQTKLLREIVALLTRIERNTRDEYDEERCPACGSNDLLEASVMGSDRYVCGKCGEGMTKEAVNG